MNKKEYIKPRCPNMEIDEEVLMAGSVNVNNATFDSNTTIEASDGVFDAYSKRGYTSVWDDEE